MPIGQIELPLRKHYQVEPCQQGSIFPETFPDDSLYRVSHNSFSQFVFRNCQTQPRMIQTIIAGQNQKPAVGRTYSGFENFLKLGGFVQPLGLQEAFRACSHIVQAARRLRPFALLDFNTRRPPLVRIRRRNP